MPEKFKSEIKLEKKRPSKLLPNTPAWEQDKRSIMELVRGFFSALPPETWPQFKITRKNGTIELFTSLNRIEKIYEDEGYFFITYKGSYSR